MISEKWNAQALRDAVIASVAVLAISSLVGYAVYHTASEGLKKEVQSNLLSLAKSASNVLDGDLHEQITQPEQKGSETYEAARSNFFKLLRANENIAFIYTVIPRNEKIFFILDSKIIKPGEEDDTSGVMEEYTDATDTMKQALGTRTAMVEEEAYTDEWGTFLSGYAPIHNSKGEYLGIVGADIRLTDYMARLAKIQHSLYLGMAIALLAATICGIGVYYARKRAINAEAMNHQQQERMAAMEISRVQEQQQAMEEAEKQKRAGLEEMAQHFERSVKGMVSQVASAAVQMRAGAADVTSIASDTRERSGRVANLTNDTAQTTAQIAAAAEELSASIREIRAQTQRSSEVALDASGKAGSARDLIHTLAERSEKVNTIIGAITTIAGQINLLALNATIESARAGEAGKGFAVVASEVKNLATQVAKATDEITSQIHGMQEATQRSVDSVMEIIQIIETVSQNSRNVAEAVEQQSQVTGEIARNIAHTSNGTQDISANIASVQEGAERTGSTAAQVLTSAENLAEQSAQLSEKVDQFLISIRAG